MGERALTKLQWGLETVNGTAVAADTILLAGSVPPVKRDRIPTLIQDDAGVRAKSVRNAPRIDTLLYRDSLTFSDLYFQVLPIIFSMGVKGNVTPAEQNPAEGDYLWTFTPSMTATNTPDSGTLEFGDDTQAYEVEYMMVESFRLAGEVSQDGGPSPVSLEVNWFGRQLTPAAFTGALSIPSTNEVNAKVARFYLDTTWAGIGGTEKTGLLRSFDIEVLTGVHPKSQGGANKYYDTHGQGDFEVNGSFIFEGNSDADAIFDAFQAGTKQFVEVNISGPQIGAGDNHNLALGAGGFWTDVQPLNQVSNGNNLHSAVFNGSYDLTGAQILKLTALTNVAAI